MTKFIIGIIIAGVTGAASLFFYVKYDYTQSKMARLVDCGEPDERYATDMSGMHYDLLLVGDSRAWEYGLWLDANTDLEVLNLAAPGETSQETVCKLTDHEQKLDILSRSNTKLLISLGINDLVTASLNGRAERTEIERKAIQNVVEISTLLSRRVDKVLVLSVVPPIKIDPLRRLMWGTGISDSVMNMNSRLSASLPSNVELLDLEPIFFDAKKNEWRQDLARDALHWNADGYTKLHSQIELRDPD